PLGAQLPAPCPWLPAPRVPCSPPRSGLAQLERLDGADDVLAVRNGTRDAVDGDGLVHVVLDLVGEEQLREIDVGDPGATAVLDREIKRAARPKRCAG